MLTRVRPREQGTADVGAAQKAAGAVLTAKQAPHRPGTALALGLRAGCDVASIVEQTNFAKERLMTWLQLDGNPATVDIVAGPALGVEQGLYQRHADGKIWEYTGTPMTGWKLLDDNPATAQIVAAIRESLFSPGSPDPHQLYQRHADGKIWEYTGTPMTGWLQIDGNPATVDIVSASSRLYQRHGDGKLWAFTGMPMTGWKLLDSNPATLQMVAGRTLFQRHNSGAIFELHEPGPVIH